MTPRPGAPVPIVVRKYDGRRRFRVETRCLAVTPALLVLRGEPGRPFVTDAGTRRLATTTLEYFPRAPGHWYNVVSFFDTGSGALERHFCNILAPWRWDGATLEYVDLDLDLVVAPDGALTIEDCADFRRHARAWRYPAALRRGALAALRELRRLAASGHPPFTADPLPVATARALAGETVWAVGRGP
ncbi:MAG TPA: DUF402 domain-containing protein [Thermomicrobiales bacterium]|nr:DUF402 domain-containing protein [Thermomicrobiales bacterium]